MQDANFNWIRFLWLVRFHKISSLARHRLPNELPVPQEILDQLDIEAEENLTANRRKREAINILSEKLAKEKIAFKLFDPSLLAEQYYESEGLRSHDHECLTVTVTQQGIQACINALRAMDYRQRSRRVFLSHDSAYSITIEIAKNWNPKALEHASAPYANDEEALLKCCLLAARDTWRRWCYAYDIARILKTRSNELNWDKFVSLGACSNSQRICIQSLLWACRISSTSTPRIAILSAGPELLSCLWNSTSTLPGLPLTPGDRAKLAKLRLNGSTDRLSRLLQKLVHLLLPIRSRLRGARRKVGDYIPSNLMVAQEINELAEVSDSDTVHDLGCGDGRILIEAAKRGARGVGIDIDGKLVALARENARQAGVADLLTFRAGNLFELRDLATASVVTVYLNQDAYPDLETFFNKTLKPNTRVVSHRYLFLNRPACESRVVKVAPGRVSYVYRWNW